MKTPKTLEPLVRDGLVDEVIHSLKSGSLTPDVKLTGHFKGSNKEADLDSIMRSMMREKRSCGVRRGEQEKDLTKPTKRESPATALA